ncbi:hypothetical protein ANN_19546 [Periplaneta americana]|uniref:Uncharacterized protein n=1 Tax=Periplaneta americana TaxID=6978 RepID=A0ABQ8SAE3_PERAM|nr:hypothetical protein ANN_19546 [Periplaneta americana]
MDLREVGCDDRDWINLAQDRDRWRAYGAKRRRFRWKVLDHPPYSTDLGTSHFDFFGSLKKHLSGKRFNHQYGRSASRHGVASGN